MKGLLKEIRDFLLIGYLELFHIPLTTIIHWIVTGDSVKESYDYVKNDYLNYTQNRKLP